MLLKMKRLRIITLNIAHGRGITLIQGLTSPRKIRVNLRKIASLLTELDPDIVAFQEIDEKARWSGNFDHLDYLRVHSEFPFASFGVNNRRKGLINLNYGNAFLSKYPILQTETVVFGRKKIGEKGFLFAEIEFNGKTIPIINLHLHASSRAQRMGQIEHLGLWLKNKTAHASKSWIMPPIVCGDFNNSNERDDATAYLWSLLTAYSDYILRPINDATYPSPFPRRRLDFIFMPVACRSVECKVIRTIISDHCPVLVDFSIL
jgi:endonuclease/exonuclease/phosphatase family metal-dependent hydrolase